MDWGEGNIIFFFKYINIFEIQNYIVYKTTMASYKIQKANGAAPADETELAVAQALVDLESSIPELRPLVITNAKEV
jgi:hypothetical protein